MSVPALAELAGARPTATRRGVGARVVRPRRAVEPDAAASLGGLTVTITVQPEAVAAHPDVIEALRKLLAAAGPQRVSVQPAVEAAIPSLVPATVAGPAVAAPARVVLDRGTRAVTVDGQPLELSRLEYDLLLFLAEHPRRVFDRQELLQLVWGSPRAGDRTVDVHVSRLRAKFGERLPVISTVYGIGYRLADDASLAVVGA